MRTRKKRHGFSLLELLAVMTVLGILAALIAPRATSTADVEAQRLHDHNRSLINATVERYYRDKGYWPAANLGDIGGDLDYFPKGVPTNPVDPSAPYAIDKKTHLVRMP